MSTKPTLEEIEAQAKVDEAWNTPITGTMDERYDKCNKVSATFEYGNGTYSPYGYQIASGSMLLFGFTPKMAEKLGKQAMSDYGKAMSSEKAEGTFKSKSAAKGKLNLSGSLKFKGHDGTPALRIATAIQWASDAVKNGVGYGQTTWQLFPSEEIVEYLAELQK